MRVGAEIIEELDRLGALKPEELIKQRREKFLDIGRNLLT